MQGCIVNATVFLDVPGHRQVLLGMIVARPHQSPAVPSLQEEARQRQPAPSESTAASREVNTLLQFDAGQSLQLSRNIICLRCIVLQDSKGYWTRLVTLGEASCKVVIARAEAYVNTNNYEPPQHI